MLFTQNLQNHLRLEGQSWGLHIHCGKDVRFISDVMLQFASVTEIQGDYKRNDGL
jgi:hypothetical protein